MTQNLKLYWSKSTHVNVKWPRIPQVFFFNPGRTLCEYYIIIFSWLLTLVCVVISRVWHVLVGLRFVPLCLQTILVLFLVFLSALLGSSEFRFVFQVVIITWCVTSFVNGFGCCYSLVVLIKTCIVYVLFVNRWVKLEYTVHMSVVFMAEMVMEHTQLC